MYVLTRHSFIKYLFATCQGQYPLKPNGESGSLSVLMILWLDLCADKIKGESHAKQTITCRTIFSFLSNLTLEIIASTK